MINGGATHVGVATDHVIESFRNQLWPGYKTGDGIDPDLLAQFPLLEEALDGARRRGVADGRVRGRRCAGRGGGDGGGRPARRARAHLHAGQGSGAVRPRHARRADGSPRRARSATKPAWSRSSACRRRRFPTTWRSSATAPTAIRACPAGARSRPRPCWRKFRHLEAIPADWRTWGVNAASAGAWPRRWSGSATQAFLFRDLATLRTDIPLFESVDELRWKGPTPAFAALAARLDAAVTQSAKVKVQRSSSVSRLS